MHIFSAISCSHYSCISKRAKTINVMRKAKNKKSTQHLAIDFTGSKSTVEENGK
ncbi:Mobile element protein [Candidatus Enterovibrio altilux]|uniref:Mobile element protein n=1 Tax=Candidatus Enterovibrio altilux TaxID=1927128 RepID=A0A291B9J0_9GAMM|nr:Mobile element protein [Candidatus Enterovibrio luxaltus]